MGLNKNKIINICDQANLISLYAIAYFLPISKAIIETASITVIFCYLIKKFTQWEDIAKTYINIPLFTYLIICIFSIFISSNIEISCRTMLFKVLKYFLLFFAIVETLNSERRLKNITLIFLVSSALLGIDGIYQSFTHKDFLRNRSYIVEGRISASLATPNDFGTYLISALPFSIVFSFYKFRQIVWRILSGLLAILLFICLIMTISKGAWCGFIASVIFISIWIPSLIFFSIAILLFIILTRQYYTPSIRYRIDNFFIFDASSLNDAGSLERKMIWKIALKIFRGHPWFGAGLGTFMFNFSKLIAVNYPYGVAYAHNCYLQIATEIGIFGLLSFLSILALFFYHGVRVLFNKLKTFSWYVLLASSAGLLAYCVQMGVDTSFYSLDLGTLFWLIVGLGIAALKQTELGSADLNRLTQAAN